IEERFDIAIRAKPVVESVAGLVAKTFGSSQRVLVPSRWSASAPAAFTTPGARLQSASVWRNARSSWERLERSDLHLRLAFQVEALAVPTRAERSAHGVEDDLAAAGLETVGQDPGARERRVPAEADLGLRREPPQAPARAVRNEKGGLRKVVLVRDRLEHRVL